MAGYARAICPRHRRCQPARAPALTAVVAALTLLASAATVSAQAQDLVQNGSFAITRGTASFEFSTQSTSTGSIADWTSGGYNFVYYPGSTAANPGSIFLATNPTSPTGGNYIASDPVY
jgi:hypothetical protein